MKEFFGHLLEVYLWVITVAGLIGGFVGALAVLIASPFWLLGVGLLLSLPLWAVGLKHLIDYRFEHGGWGDD